MRRKRTKIRSWLSSTFVCSGSPVHSQLGFSFLLARQEGTKQDLKPQVTDMSLPFLYFFHRCEGSIELWVFCWANNTLIHLSLLQSKPQLTFQWSNTDSYGPFFIISLPRVCHGWTVCWTLAQLVCALSVFCFDRARRWVLYQWGANRVNVSLSVQGDGVS